MNPKKRSFPLEKARKLYEEFPEPRDMTFEKFYEELLAISDPTAMSHDLQCMKLSKSMQNENQRKIEGALAQQENIRRITSN